MSESLTRKLGPGSGNESSDSAPQADGPGPTAFGRYQVVRHLASGGMGAVYLARDGVLQRDVAVKIIRPLPGKLGQEFSARFLNEARCVASLKHPNIVPIFDLGLEGDSPYLVMEVVEGPSLGDVISNKGITLREARVIGIQIANALAEAHRAGIVHRDVKPGNILRSGPESWKLVDFGVAHVPDSSLTGVGDFLGTPSYAAPESLEGNGFSASSDVYGLAATLYHALGGQPPFGLGNAVKIALRACSEEAPSLANLSPNLPDDFVQVIDRCLAKDASRRPSAAELAELLASARAESQDSLRVERSSIAFEATAHVNTAELSAAHSRHGSAVGPAPRKSRAWLAAAGLALLVVGVSAFALTGNSGDGGDSAERAKPVAKKSTPAATAALPRDEQEGLAEEEPAVEAGEAEAVGTESDEPDDEADDEPAAENALEQEAKPGLSEIGSPEPYLEGLAEVEKLRKRRALGQATRSLDLLRKKYPASAYLPFLQGSIYMERRFWQDGFAAYRSAIGNDPRYREHPQVVRDAIRSLYSKSKPWMAVQFIEKSLGAPARPALEKALASASNSAVKSRIAALLKKLPR